MRISFDYQVPSFRIKNKKRLTDWILLIAFLEKKEIEKIDFIFCNDEYLLRLNKKFLSHKNYTDVLTFNYSEKKKSIIAEIYSSIDRVRENAKVFNVSFEEELNRVIIHGVLHCMGYQDKNDHDLRKMHKKEDECLRLLAEMKKS
jgi:probable rRNA maturation factor